LASIAPVTAAAGSADLTVTLTGTNFSAACEVLVNGAVFPSTFVSATSMTIVAKPLLIPAQTVYNVAVRKGLVVTASKPFTFT
jgi:IPT/TIG domain